MHTQTSIRMQSTSRTENAARLRSEPSLAGAPSWVGPPSFPISAIEMHVRLSLYRAVQRLSGRAALQAPCKDTVPSRKKQ